MSEAVEPPNSLAQNGTKFTCRQVKRNRKRKEPFKIERQHKKKICSPKRTPFVFWQQAAFSSCPEFQMTKGNRLSGQAKNIYFAYSCEENWLRKPESG